MTERAEMEAVIEAVLFVVAEPVPRSRLIELFDEDERETAAAALEAVLARYGGTRGEVEPEPEVERTAEAERQAEWRGVMVEEVAGGVRLVTRPELVGWLRRFFDVSGGTKLSMAALETLAIIAYRQPITGPEIQELRSVSPVGVLKTLLERRLVRIAGRKEVVGKPFLYATTREFLIHFGLKSLKDLPPLEDFEEAFGGLAQGSAGELLPGFGDREEQILVEAAALEEAAAASAGGYSDGEEGEPADSSSMVEVLLAEGEEGEP